MKGFLFELSVLYSRLSIFLSTQRYTHSCVARRARSVDRLSHYVPIDREDFVARSAMTTDRAYAKF